MKIYCFFGTGSKRHLRPVMTVAQVLTRFRLTEDEWHRLLIRQPWIPLPVDGSPYNLKSLFEMQDIVDIGDILQMDANERWRAQQSKEEKHDEIRHTS